MQNQDWEKLGEDIRRTVQDAIDSQDFNKLNQNINNTLNDAIGSVRSGLKSAGSALEGAAQNLSQEATRRAYQNAWRQGQRTKQDGETIIDQEQILARRDAQLFAKPTGTRVGGILMATFGGVFGAGFLLADLLIAAITTMTLGGVSDVQFLLQIFGFLAFGNVLMLWKGLRKLGYVKRFYVYRDEVRRLGYCEIKKLSEVTNKSQKKVLKELNRMISQRWFREGHVDEQRTSLIASDEVYKEYKLMLENQRTSAENERIRMEREAELADSVSPEVQEILKNGNDYIRMIHESNDAIPGIEISNKISRMEELVDRIFDRVEQDPSAVTGIRRLMDYYLPTTIKLLNAYEELDNQPVQGENIISSKEEIEKTLDTLNVAFEKLLDDLFQRTAWDVSSDISVLNTMLAQEGLKEDDFQKQAGKMDK
ncbi:MAG: 5-bromo-4-chloroindolyl phosphate hydrolysis family protein [Hespellia sp.]|nr:5-bromo-4-chloroindolyl phosphate hydrolysis family protein [Hespellia sp.]